MSTEIQLVSNNSNIAIKEVNEALELVKPSFEIFNHSHTQFTWKVQNLSHKGTSRNMRQVTAELNRKRQALSENKFKFLKKKLNLEKKLKENPEDPIVQLEAEELQEQMEFLRIAYEGCMKDVMVLSELHEQLKQKLIDEYGEYNEETLEKDEKKYWVRRLFAQSLRDIRSGGMISAGNQEALEQININPSFAYKLCNEYLQKELQDEDTECNMLDTFLDEAAASFSDNVLNLIKKKGLSTKTETKYLTL